MVPAVVPEEARARAKWRRLALVAATSTYLLIVLGGVVRITESGMGCGDDWPLCHGRLLPPMDLETALEYGHRLAAGAVSVLVLGLAALAWRPGRGEGWRRARRLGLAALLLLLLQVALGAVTVRLELPPASVILHLATAMALLGVLVVAGWRDEHAGPVGSCPGLRAAGAGVAAGFVVVLVGGLVANLDATWACQGFPLCNGRWLPGSNWRIQLQWMHRVLAYGLVAWAFLLPVLTGRWRPGDRPARLAAWTVAALAGAQLAVAAAMVLGSFPVSLRALHLAAGTAVFVALLVHARVLAGRGGGSPA